MKFVGDIMSKKKFTDLYRRTTQNEGNKDLGVDSGIRVEVESKYPVMRTVSNSFPASDSSTYKRKRIKKEDKIKIANNINYYRCLPKMI